MFKNFTPKTLLILGAFIAYALFVFFKYDEIVNLVVTSSLGVALILYIVFNPAYLFIMYGIWTRFGHRRAWKRIIAIVVGIFSLDFLAIPRLIITDSLVDGAAVSTNIGAIIMRALETSLSHNVAYYAMYLILPILGLALSVELLGITNFVKEMK